MLSPNIAARVAVARDRPLFDLSCCTVDGSASGEAREAGAERGKARRPDLQ